MEWLVWEGIEKVGIQVEVVEMRESLWTRGGGPRPGMWFGALQVGAEPRDGACCGVHPRQQELRARVFLVGLFLGSHLWDRCAEESLLKGDFVPGHIQESTCSRLVGE